MSQIASEHEALVKQAEELQQQIDEATQGVMDAQAAAQTGRNKLGIYATQEYKTGGISLIKVLLESQSISDLVNNMQYFDAIQEDQARQIAEQKQLEATLNDALDDLNKKKDEQVKAISDAEAKQTEAQQVVAQATAHLSDAQAAAEAARLAELQKQAEALKAQQEAQSQTEQAPAEESKGAAEKAEESGNGAASNSGNQSSSGSSSGSSNSNGSGSNNSNSSNTSTSGWQSGVVSAYGSNERWHAGRPHRDGRNRQRKLYGRGCSYVYAQLPILFWALGRNQLWWPHGCRRGERLRWPGRWLPCARFAAWCMEGPWREQLFRLGRAHRFLPFPVGASARIVRGYAARFFT